VNLLIRPAHPGELGAIGRLTLDAYAADGHVSPTDEYASVLLDAASRARSAEVYVATDEADRLLGTVTFCPEGSDYREIATAGEGEFRMLAVAPDARRRGVAEALVRLCVERSTELGYTALVLSSQATQTAAHRLYERIGFRRTPDLDWAPVPSIDLLAYRLELTGFPSR
jgi:ribosomal protein S18 acetylase RimI-like enzyme